jgi:hypothetical protein
MECVVDFVIHVVGDAEALTELKHSGISRDLGKAESGSLVLR